MPKNRIVQQGDPNERDYVLSEAADPGMLMEFGGSDDVQKHSTANGGLNPVAVLREQKENDGAGVEDQVAASDLATILFPSPGDVVLVRLGFGSSEHTITVGEALESGGDGTVQSHGTAAGSGEEGTLKLVALEALDNSSGSATALLKALVV